MIESGGGVVGGQAGLVAIGAEVEVEDEIGGGQPDIVVGLARHGAGAVQNEHDIDLGETGIDGESSAVGDAGAGARDDDAIGARIGGGEISQRETAGGRSGDEGAILFPEIGEGAGAGNAGGEDGNAANGAHEVGEGSGEQRRQTATDGLVEMELVAAGDFDGGGEGSAAKLTVREPPPERVRAASGA